MFVSQTNKVDSGGWISLSLSFSLFFPPVITMKRIEVHTITLLLGFHQDSPRELLRASSSMMVDRWW